MLSLFRHQRQVQSVIAQCSPKKIFAALTFEKALYFLNISSGARNQVRSSLAVKYLYIYPIILQIIAGKVQPTHNEIYFSYSILINMFRNDIPHT